MGVIARRIIICLLAALLASCAPRERKHSVNGTWRAVLTSPGGELPFTLEIGRGRVVVINGAERAPASSVLVDGTNVTIGFKFYDSVIHATLSGASTMNGEWTRVVPSGTARLPFRATRGAQPRFVPVSNPVRSDVSGIWKAEFTDSDGTSPARGEFHQDAGSTRVTGTFLTPTGDHRYLEGSFEGGLLRLSTFDGAHAFLFQAREGADGSLKGDFWNRDSYHATWTATRSDDAGATLPDGWKDVALTNASGHFAFRFPDLDGHPVSLTDDRFRGKAVVVNLFGSWCPNCNDEAPLLAEWDKKYRSRGLEIVGLAYEFTGNVARDREMVRRFAQRHHIQYTLLLAGVNDKAKASATLPDLTRVLAYPTSVFIGRDGKVRRIYSGFAGPGTGAHYTQLRKELESEVEKLLMSPRA